MASNERQQRRRKIMDKGIDRFALITGQIKNLEESVTPKASDNPNPNPDLNPNSNPNPNRSHHSHTESSPPIMVSRDFVNSINAGLIEKAKSSKMVKMRTITPTTDIVEPIPTNVEEKAPNTITTTTTTEDNINTTTNNTNDHNNDNTNANAHVTTSTNITNTDTNTNAPVATSSNNLTVFSSKKINQSIIYSERVRAICSMIIGLLVIVKSGEGFITSRPFYLILLTDVTIVVARLFAGSGDEVEDKRTAPGGGENLDDAFKLLERGLVLYQAIRAIFIDSSIYLVVVISALSVTYNL